MKSIGLLFYTFLLLGCDYYDDRLVLRNNFNYNVVIEMYHDSVPSFSETNTSGFYLSKIIEQKQEMRFLKIGSQNGWPFFLINSSNNKLNVAVFNADSLRKYGDIKYLIEFDLFDMYSYPIKDLEKKEWRITVPQVEARVASESE